MQASTRINEAYRVLKDPLSRASYLLSLHAGEGGGENETTGDMAFLMEQMELREALASAGGQPDPYAVVARVMDRLDAQRAELVGALSERLDGSVGGDLEPARELVRKLQFVEKCRAEAEGVEAELDDAL
jgi:molecular chaperone HscB